MERRDCAGFVEVKVDSVLGEDSVAEADRIGVWRLMDGCAVGGEADGDCRG